MKYSSLFGFIFSIALIVFCFTPWVSIDYIHKTLTGFDTAGTSFGKPGIFHTTFALISSVLFVLPNISSKRVNIGVTAINLSWSLRNFLIFNLCSMGECPRREIGIYGIVFCSVGLMVFALFPKNNLISES